MWTWVGENRRRVDLGWQGRNVRADSMELLHGPIIPKPVIFIVLSETGQKNALLSCLDARKKQEFLLPVTKVDGYVNKRVSPILLERVLELGARIEENGRLIFDTYSAKLYHYVYDTPPRDAMHAIELYEEAYKAEIKRKEEQEKQKQVDATIQ